MSNIEYHEGHLAICVKNRNIIDMNTYPFFKHSNLVVEMAYEECKEAFWEDLAPRISEKYGYGKVYSEGRSGGWLTVEFPPALFWPERSLLEHSAKMFREECARCVDNEEEWKTFAEEIRAEMEYCCNERLIEISK